MSDTIFNTMYRFSGQLSTTGFTRVLQSSDIISISFIHNYDKATYPIIRIRIYADMELITYLTDAPDHINVAITLYGNIYKTDKTDNTNSIVHPVNSITFSGKGYIENKNAPVSRMDHYKSGIRDTDDLNVDSKIPCELFVYDERVIHKMRERVKSVYRNTTVETVCRDIFKQVGLSENNIKIDPIHNQQKYDQILIPNMMAIESFSFFEKYYGLYHSGGSLYCDMTSGSTVAYLCESDTTYVSDDTTIPIYVRGEKSDSNGESGIFISDGIYRHQTQALNVSVLTESDIEGVMNPTVISSTNVNSFTHEESTIPDLYRNQDKNITPKQILHKYDSAYLSRQVASRIEEKITEIDLAAAGFDVALFKPSSRIQLIFESPIRGLNMNKLYRIKNICHTFSNVSGDLFGSETTMQLCSNY